MILQVSYCTKESTDVKLFSKGLDLIVKKFFVRENLTFDFLIYGKSCESFATGIIVNIVKLNPDFGPFEVMVEDEIIGNKNIELFLIKSTIIFVKFAENVSSLNQQLRMDHNDVKKFLHIIVIQEGIPHFFESKFDKFDFSNMINYEILMFKVHKSLMLKTIERFAASTSRKKFNFTLIEVDEFNSTKGEWKNQNFELRNKHFNGGRLIVNEAIFEKSRYLYKIVTELSLKLNFTLVPRNDGIFIKNPFLYFEPKAIYVFGQRFVYKFFEDELAWVIPLGEEYTSYEKFILPFETETWICCGITFGAGFMAIIIINLSRNNKLQNAIFGHKVKSPALNILIAFFGQSQNILPSTNFARCILIWFIFFCFIVRCGYQGIQFDLIFKVSVEF